MNLEQVSCFIGLAKPSVYELVHERKNQYFKTGKRLYFKKSVIVNWITATRVKTKQEIEQMANEYIYKNPLG